MQATTDTAIERLRRLLLSLSDEELLTIIELWRAYVSKVHRLFPRHLHHAPQLRQQVRDSRGHLFLALACASAFHALASQSYQSRSVKTPADQLQLLADVLDTPSLDRRHQLDTALTQYHAWLASLRAKREKRRAARQQQEEERAQAAAQIAARVAQQREDRAVARSRCLAGEMVTTDGGHELTYDAEHLQFSCRQCQHQWQRIPAWSTRCPGPPKAPQERPAYCYRSTLTERYGLTDVWIRRLGPPDQYVDNPHNRRGPPAMLYLVTRVEAFIAAHQEEYIQHIERRTARRAFVQQAARQAVATRRRNQVAMEDELRRIDAEDRLHEEHQRQQQLRHQRAVALARIGTPEHIEDGLHALMYLNRWAKAKDRLLYADRQGLYSLKADILKHVYQATLIVATGYVRDASPFDPWRDFIHGHALAELSPHLLQLQEMALHTREPIETDRLAQLGLWPADFDLVDTRDDSLYQSWEDVPEQNLAFLDPEYYSLITFHYESTSARFVFHMPLRIAQSFLTEDVLHQLLAHPCASRELGERYGRSISDDEQQQHTLPQLFADLQMPLEFYCPHGGEDKQAYLRRKTRQRYLWHEEYDDEDSDDWW